MAKAATAAKTPMEWRDRGREGVKTRKRQSGDRGKTPKRVPRQFVWPCIAAFCAFGENETEGRTSSLKSRDRGKNALGAAARGRKGRRPGESGPKGHRGIAVDHDLLCHFLLPYFGLRFQLEIDLGIIAQIRGCLCPHLQDLCYNTAYGTGNGHRSGMGEGNRPSPSGSPRRNGQAG